MLYAFFLILSILYNIRKFRKEKNFFINSLIDAKSANHREMILSHNFHIFIFEAFLAIIVAHLITERAFAIGLLGLGIIYVILVAIGLFLFQYFLKFVEKSSSLELRKTFNHHIIREFRVSFALIMLPILLYSIISWTFDDGANEWGDFWLLGMFTNIIFVSVLTIACTVIIMLRLIPNREISEPEYLNLIDLRLKQIGLTHMRARWIETDIKNAFVVGIKLLRLSNQTMFVGKNLRTTLSLEEFDAVIAHELAHVANRHIPKRVIEIMKNFVSMMVGLFLITIIVLLFSYLYYGEDVDLYRQHIAILAMTAGFIWFFVNYALFFDTLRSHEFEADAFAVMKLGASKQALQSALEKLTHNEEIPEYLRSKIKDKKQKNKLETWIGKVFSTHPSLEERMEFLNYKIENGLPFNYYVSTAQKVRIFLGRFLQWKVSVPIGTVVASMMVWSIFSVRHGKALVAIINTSDAQTIINNPEVLKSINRKPLLVGQSLMYYIVKKRDPELIDFFVQHGAEKGRTLVYISSLKDFELLKKYYALFQSDLTQDDYFLILRKTAEVNFTDGYRHLVQSSQFESLDPAFKADVTKVHQSSEKARRPASNK